MFRGPPEGKKKKGKKRGGPLTPCDCDRKPGPVPCSRVQENPGGMGMGRPRWEGLVEPIPISSASKGLTEAIFPSLRGVFSHVTEVYLRRRESAAKTSRMFQLQDEMEWAGRTGFSAWQLGEPAPGNVMTTGDLILSQASRLRVLLTLPFKSLACPGHDGHRDIT
jgi:hypothetical protein